MIERTTWAAWLSSRPTIRRREWVFVAVFSLATLATVLLPTLSGLWQQPAGSTYLYTNIPDVDDFQVYYADIAEVAHGRLLNDNPYTSLPQRGTLLQPIWIVLGSLMRVGHLSAPIAFLLGKLGLGAGLLVTLYAVLAHFFSDVCWRRIGLGMLVWGSGFGGLLMAITHGRLPLIEYFIRPSLFPQLPTDLTHVMGYGWLTLWHSPHLIASQILLVFITWWFFRSFVSGDRTSIHKAGGAMALLLLIHPYDPVLWFGMAALWWILGVVGDGFTGPSEARRYLRQLGILILWSLPVAAYYLVVLTTLPSIRGYYEQNILLPPSMWNVMLGYGLLLPFMMIGLRSGWTKQRAGTLLLFGWIVAAIVLLYFPHLKFWAKMMNGLYLPIGILATMGIKYLWTRWRSRRVPLAMLGAVAFIGLFFSQPYFLVKIIDSQRRESGYHYAPTSLIDGLQWLERHSPQDAVVLGDFRTGNITPHFALRRTWLGHNIQTVGYKEKLPVVRQWFFANDGDVAAKERFLAQERISYVIWGADEQALGSFRPDHVPILERVFSAGQTNIYAVRNLSASPPF